MNEELVREFLSRRRILDQVHALLRPDGLLFLGGAETTINLHDRFARVPVPNAGCYQPLTGASPAHQGSSKSPDSRDVPSRGGPSRLVKNSTCGFHLEVEGERQPLIFRLKAEATRD